MDRSVLMDLAAALRKLSDLDDEAVAQLAPLVRQQDIGAGSHLLRAGERATNGAMVLRGVLREFFILADGKERTRWFAREGDLIGSLSDLLSGLPARASIVALTPAKVLVVPWVAFDNLCQREHSWSMFARRLAESLYIRKSEREYELLALPADERYQRFRERHPGLETRVSQVHVASYLGITPEHLSRLRRRHKAS